MGTSDVIAMLLDMVEVLNIVLIVNMKNRIITNLVYNVLE